MSENREDLIEAFHRRHANNIDGIVLVEDEDTPSPFKHCWACLQKFEGEEVLPNGEPKLCKDCQVMKDLGCLPVDDPEGTIPGMWPPIEEGDIPAQRATGEGLWGVPIAAVIVIVIAILVTRGCP